MPQTRRKPSQWSALSALALVSQLGLVVAVCIVGGVVVGQWLDSLVSGRGLVLVAMILLGVASGVYGAWRILAKEVDWRR